MRARSIVFAFLFVASSIQAQDRHASEIRRLETFIEAEMARQQMPGLSVAIAHGDFKWSRGFGFADLENRVPAKAESSYRTASVAKPITAAAVLRLVEQGRIDLDAEVQTYVPHFPRKAHPVTVRQLLQHLGGISHYKNYQVEGRIREPRNTKESLAVFQDWDLVAEPGTRYQYSSYGYNLLGAVVEGASGKPFGAFMADQVWKPLGMTNTRLDDPRAIIPNRVRGYALQNGELRNSEYVNMSSRFGGGGSRSTVDDLLTFIIGLSDAKLLKRETVDMMTTSGVTKAGLTTRYGFGIGLVPQNGRFRLAHGGSQEETRTDLSWFPSIRFGYAVASNFEDADIAPITNEIARLFLSDSWNLSYYTPRRDDQSALQAMGLTWNNGLGSFDRHGRAPDTPASAFQYFNRAVDSTRIAKVTGEDKMIVDGRHSVAGEPFIKTGAYMAAALAKSGKDLNEYHREGEFAFFDDYIRLYRSSKAIPRTHRFEPSFEKRVAEWRKSWSEVWRDEVRTFSPGTAGDLDRLTELAPRFRASPIIPDYVGNLIDLGERSAQSGQPQVAVRVSKMLLDLYPDSAGAKGFGGVMAAVSGQVDRARTLLTESRQQEPNGYASKSNLEEIASALDRMGAKDAAKLLRELP